MFRDISQALGFLATIIISIAFVFGILLTVSSIIPQ